MKRQTRFPRPPPARPVLTPQDTEVRLDAIGSGRHLATQVITSGTSIVSHAEAVLWRFTLIGGGGGGGGSPATIAGTSAPGDGGSAGAVCIGEATVTPSTSYTCAVGAAGAASSGAAGTAGGNTTLAIGATTYSAGGGPGGRGGVQSAAAEVSPSTPTAAVAANGEVANIRGQLGGLSVRVSGEVAITGAGGGGPYGDGGYPVTGNLAGIDASGYGAGGSGAATSGAAGAAKAGGVGAQGLIIVEEYA